jgi:hypothetical protein
MKVYTWPLWLLAGAIRWVGLKKLSLWMVSPLMKVDK